MTLKGLLNWLISAAAAGAATFVITAFGAGVPTEGALAAAAAAAITAAVQHLRERPLP